MRLTYDQELRRLRRDVSRMMSRLGPGDEVAPTALEARIRNSRLFYVAAARALKAAGASKRRSKRGLGYETVWRMPCEGCSGCPGECLLA
jgi:hypothetical protein